MRVNVAIKTDTKLWQRMKKNLLKGGDKEARVGWFGGNMHPSGIPTAQVAQLNERGHRNGPGSMFPGTNTPPRPFMRVGFVPKSLELLPTFIPMVNQVAMGTLTWTKVHEQMGVKLKSTLQDVIEAWSTPPNSPTTVELKGKNDPLIESGWMLDTVQSRVVRKGSA